MATEPGIIVPETRMPYPGLLVSKHGRSSGFTMGEVSRFKLQQWQGGQETVEICVVQEEGMFGAKGDSGSLVIRYEEDDVAAVGLLTGANVPGVFNTITAMWAIQREMEAQLGGRLEWLGSQ
jgi:hypothetical protein